MTWTAPHPLPSSGLPPAGPLRMKGPAPGVAIAVILLAAILIAVRPPAAGAQQFVVDDAGTTASGACQVEGWWGDENSWLLPACRLRAGPEVTLGFGSVREDPGSRTLEWVLQAKRPVRDPDEDGWGWSAVAGIGGDPLAQVTGRHLRSAFVYVPLTAQASAVTLHLNLGWLTELDGEEAERSHAATWGMRGDVEVHPRLAIIGEVAGEGGGRPLRQVGARIPIRPDRLLVDLSWGGRPDGERSGSGWAVGTAWTPPPFR